MRASTSRNTVRPALLLTACALSLWACAEADSAANGDGVGGDLPGFDAAPSGGNTPPGGGGTPGDPSVPTPGGNRRPELTRIGDRQAEVGVPLELVLEGSDPDGDEVSFNVRSTLPEGAKFEKGSARFTWTPSPAQEGTIVILTFEVSDGALRDQETIQLSVVAAGAAQNGAPVIDPLGDQLLNVGRPFALQVQATDPNGDDLTFSLLGGESLPGASLDAKTGLFEWTPPAEAEGQSYGVTFVVSDGANESTAVVALVVRGADVAGDLPPRITPIDDREVAVGQAVRIEVQAEDENTPALVYDLVTPPPPGAVFDASTHVLQWTPTPDQQDLAFRFVFRVSDGRYRAIEQVTLTVVAGNGGGPMPGACPAEPGDDGGSPDPAPRALSPDAPTSASICPANDADGFTFEVDADETFTVDLRFAHADGDLDLIVEGPGGLLTTSDSVDDDESVVATARASGRHTATVVGYNGATNANYTVSLAVNGGGGPDACVADAAEGATGNDEAAEAVDLRAHLDDTLRICPNDEDWFFVELEAGATAELVVVFDHAAGDLDVEVTGPDGFATASASADDDEAILLSPVPATGRYLVRVLGWQGAQNEYLVGLTEEAAAECLRDRLEANDSRADAEPLGANLFNELSWCGEPDWFKSDVPAGQELQVFVTWNDAPGLLPELVVQDAAGSRVPGQTWEVAQGDGCRVERTACRRLRYAPPAAGFVYYQLVGARRGLMYDLRVRFVPAQQNAPCAFDAQTCAAGQVCDYDAGRCAPGRCSVDDDCPTFDYLCHQGYCVELCSVAGECNRDGYACRILDGLDLCGPGGGVGQVGTQCNDFTQCGGALDCLDDAGVPDGYCSRECRADADCPGASCAVFENGNFCGDGCNADADCRAGYQCSELPRAAGGTTRVCVPR